MHMPFTTLLVAAVFTAQLLVISFIAPYCLQRNGAQLLRRYPPAQYPKLYPLPVEPDRMARNRTRQKVLNVVIGLAGAAVLARGLAQQVNAGQLGRWMIWTSMVQWLPLLLLARATLRHARMAREQPAPAIRTAELRPWHVHDFVSRNLVIAGFISVTVAMIGSVLTYAFSAGAGDTPVLDALLGRPRSLTALLIVFGICALLLWRMILFTSGRAVLHRPDPYMSAEDLFKARRLRVRMLFRYAVFSGIYFTMLDIYTALPGMFGEAHLSIIVSLWLQYMYLRLVWLSQRHFASRDLEVYRVDAAAT